MSESKSKMALLNRNLRILVKTGKIVMGEKNVLKQLRTGQMKLLIIADNLPVPYKNELLHHVSLQTRKIEVFTYPGSSIDLGNQAGRPHSVASIGVEQAGDSKIIDVVKEFS
nr:50S ribosomal protein L30e [Candidatus Sigynarchaeum springense]MDO8117383.1 50S ribosomal protein L30e [Candidatus Sigynarchaeota archaeon]